MGPLPHLIPAGAVELRRWTTSLAEPMRDAVDVSFAELHTWMPWAGERPTVDGLRTVLAEGEAAFDAGTEWNYAIAWPGGDDVLGSAGLHRRGGPDSVEIGYWVRTDVTGRGIATMASRALTTQAFDSLPWVHRVEIQMDAANHRSAAVPPRLGFELIGEVDRDRDSPGQSGRGLVWAVERERWHAGTPLDG
jgi:RimJ/RimL family protein N-acetyltransferase